MEPQSASDAPTASRKFARHTEIAERALIRQIHARLKAEWEEDPSRRRGRLRDYVALLVGRAPSTVSSIISSPESSEINHTNEKMHLLDSDHIVAIREFLKECLRSGTPSSTPKVKDHLREKYALTVSERTLIRVIRKLGFRWQRAERRNIIVLSSTNISFCAQFCVSMLSNRREGVLIRPEIYLDETYCYSSINNKRTWSYKDLPFYNHASNNKVVIVGAGVICEGAAGMYAEWVPGSLHYWTPRPKAPNAPTSEQHLDEFYEDYHSNMNAGKFEHWLDKMCSNAQAYGSCIIYLDGCSAHKRAAVPLPTLQWRRQQIMEFLQQRNVTMTGAETKQELLSKVDALNIRKAYASRLIAARYGHELRFLPPYHPELNIIEKIWAVAKNKIADASPKTAAEFEDFLNIAFNEDVSSATWIGSWQKSSKFALDYVQQANADTDGHVTEETTESEESGLSEPEEEQTEIC